MSPPASLQRGAISNRSSQWVVVGRKRLTANLSQTKRPIHRQAFACARGAWRQGRALWRKTILPSAFASSHLGDCRRLTKAMADGVMGCMFELLEARRGIAGTSCGSRTEEEGVLTIRVWGLAILPRLKLPPPPRLGSLRRAWKPDIDKFWLYSPGLVIEPTPDAPAEASGGSPANPSPPAEPKVEQEAGVSPSRGIPGRRPTRDWPIVVAIEVVRLARGGVVERPTTTVMIKHCEDKIKFSPRSSLNPCGCY